MLEDEGSAERSRDGEEEAEGREAGRGEDVLQRWHREEWMDRGMMEEWN